MQLRDAEKLLITPSLDLLVSISGKPMDTPQARIMLYAIALQESRFMHRVQIRGPARGYWQFEKYGGVKGVLTHRASKPYAYTVCRMLDYECDADREDQAVRTVYNSLADNDILATCIARLLLWTDPYGLPEATDVDGAWDYYLRNWRPGKPHPETWPDLHRQAVEHVESTL